MINRDFRSIEEIIIAFPDEQTCLAHLEKLRWGNTVVSPFDSNSKVYQCKQNRYRCKNTGKYFNAKTNTLFYNSRIELQKWFIAIWLVTSEEQSTSTTKLSKLLNISQKSAWFMLKNIKKYFDIKAPIKKTTYYKPKTSERIKKEKSVDEVSVIPEKDKLQMTDWLKLLKTQ